MADLIKPGQALVTDDDWTILGEADSTAGLPASGRLILPLSRWLAEREGLIARGDVGVWLAGDEDPAVLAQDLEQLPVIAVQVPRAGDGRGYSLAVRLRTRHGFRGELRAFGEVHRDQFEALIRCGFDSLQPPAGRYQRSELERWLAAQPTISQPYQAAVLPAQPLFQRIARAA